MANLSKALFTFDVFVRYIQLEQRQRIRRPIVIYKFLDYTPLRINYLSESNGETAISTDTIVSPNQPSNQVIYFNEGKSSAFYDDFNCITKRSEVLPLYILVSESYDEASLVTYATTNINISTLFDSIRQRVYLTNSTSSPVVAVYPPSVIVLYNLMGKEVGTISMSLRLVYFGMEFLNEVQWLNDNDGSGDGIAIKSSIRSSRYPIDNGHSHRMSRRDSVYLSRNDNPYHYDSTSHQMNKSLMIDASTQISDCSKNKHGRFDEPQPSSQYHDNGNWMRNKIRRYDDQFLESNEIPVDNLRKTSNIYQPRPIIIGNEIHQNHNNNNQTVSFLSEKRSKPADSFDDGHTKKSKLPKRETESILAEFAKLRLGSATNIRRNGRSIERKNRRMINNSRDNEFHGRAIRTGFRNTSRPLTAKQLREVTDRLSMTHDERRRHEKHHSSHSKCYEETMVTKDCCSNDILYTIKLQKWRQKIIKKLNATDNIHELLGLSYRTNRTHILRLFLREPILALRYFNITPPFVLPPNNLKRSKSFHTIISGKETIEPEKPPPRKYFSPTPLDKQQGVNSIQPFVERMNSPPKPMQRSPTRLEITDISPFASKRLVSDMTSSSPMKKSLRSTTEESDTSYEDYSESTTLSKTVQTSIDLNLESQRLYNKKPSEATLRYMEKSLGNTISYNGRSKKLVKRRSTQRNIVSSDDSSDWDSDWDNDKEMNSGVATPKGKSSSSESSSQLFDPTSSMSTEYDL
ncbi:hypothetical protein SNEBB_009318 [Seison nebaliae]|nr:hypothetical protein SNEBB_009318 [Seison nebaliae]